MHPDSRSPLIAGTGALLAILGVGIALAGAWLIALGGSAYYLAAGILMCAGGALVLARSAAALGAHALLLGGTLAWALWESGLDWWPLTARLDLPFVIGLLLISPWVRRGLDRPGAPSLRSASALALCAVLAACVVAGGVALTRDPYDIAGALPAAPAVARQNDAAAQAVPPGEWRAYGRTAYGQRYSPLADITPANVGALREAWRYRSGDLRGRPGDPAETTFEVTPLKAGRRLYLCTPHQSVVALDATSGVQLWRRDIQLPAGLALQHLTCRGLSYQPPSSEPVAGGGCAAKLFMPTADGRLLALDAENGEPCAKFGGKGEIDLWANMPNRRPGAYYSTSPVVVTSKLVIVGGTVLDNVSTSEASGVIRAFDIDTGALVWNWDSANPDDTAPIGAGRQYTANSPNSWSIASVDETLGMVYLPMGNQPPDQWGGRRSAAVEKYSSSVVALDLATGKVRWVFQTVHHDLWDYDVPAQPTLVDLALGGAAVPALVQPTKQGELFVLDRRTGKPVVPVAEVPAPQGAAEGDRSAPTQPMSQLSFDPPRLAGRDMWGATMLDQLACRIALQRVRYDGRFTPPSVRGSLIHPGNFGVFNWGGVAVDPQRQIAFATPVYLAFISTLVPRPDDKALLVQQGGSPKGSLPALNENFGAPFAVKLHPFVSPLGIPCQAPPWGYVAGVDLAAGKIVWKHRNGTVRDLSPLPLPFRMGVPSLGGAVVTGGGVAFLSGTLDNYVRGYDVTTGRQLWESRLPAGGQATPMTYTGADGRQYLVVAVGGHGSTNTRAGDYVIAYALPKKIP
ncbi:membrane-bound PQQ-dependent dehydrogenase, glucose/quinate/shikimate family [Massilia sp. R2A-15]|uniref:membrane-bound PQQ-dependent dehydrogenase, glucose/quinate/shikimate family n=1 Tax=Massilia sp. R2A-15 TaxID=3064278 RepID=UPI00273333FF|nr:membrane-bound PQQ-dependent dehydrogenase, glucose/quinate/shikimate family [Massilia sp. R2A-15]WLI91612.1 membrane-bound PQQ-dependent dehydrogenase, glucose/quinate/shikimate family [Massilia sp. R2A-15]